jgi:hypothetical protein
MRREEKKRGCCNTADEEEECGGVPPCHDRFQYRSILSGQPKGITSHDAYLPLSLSTHQTKKKKGKKKKNKEDRECVHVGNIAPAAVDPAQPGDPSIDPLLLNSPARDPLHARQHSNVFIFSFFKKSFLLFEFLGVESRRKLAPKQKLQQKTTKNISRNKVLLLSFIFFFILLRFAYRLLFHCLQKVEEMRKGK